MRWKKYSKLSGADNLGKLTKQFDCLHVVMMMLWHYHILCLSQFPLIQWFLSIPSYFFFSFLNENVLFSFSNCLNVCAGDQRLLGFWYLLIDCERFFTWILFSLFPPSSHHEVETCLQYETEAQYPTVNIDWIVRDTIFTIFKVLYIGRKRWLRKHLWAGYFMI